MIKTSFASFSALAQTYQTIPVAAKLFADSLTPIQMFHQLQDEAHFLLESHDEASLWSNYSFIGLNPLYEMKEISGSFVTRNKCEETLLEAASFIELYEKTMAYLHVAPSELDLPFKGGAVGYMSYDAIETIEPSLETCYHRHTNYYQFLICETLIAFNHQENELTIIFHQRIDDNKKLQEQYFQSVEQVNRVIKKIEEPARPLTLKPTPTFEREVSFEQVDSNYQKDQFIADILKIKEYIRAGDIFQAVLSQRFSMDVKSSGIEIYRVLRKVNPSPYLFYLKLDGLEIIGSSPERLVQVQDQHVEIHPIAGTRKRGNSLEEDQKLSDDLLTDEKERAEHYMLVDLARNDIGRIAKYGSVQIPTLLEIARFSHVMHIISKVCGQLREDVKPLEALMASFPAGTVSGAPKIRAMQILKELEPTRRGIYAGAIGYLGFDGNIDSCIAIRTLVLQEGKASIQAGAGIVADSNPEKEYEETQNKAKALIRAVQMAEEMFGLEEVK
ncbi:anthranilate synthase component I [Alkalihalobacillus pseudalcaliphilus]|uniref:anthranilate synthase component I n=1 Tax=Alkalihalobacillus pseudalcaliphilus TaxID=79884 RepID=UPI00064D9361|nr:anthranilate synthase component I [Alkalihalobacillus pseudalcaliphilus]KMK76436.1 anthranilate synthase component I [Alkalihalobacillus pseudalcaliphilus]